MPGGPFVHVTILTARPPRPIAPGRRRADPPDHARRGRGPPAGAADGDDRSDADTARPRRPGGRRRQAWALADQASSPAAGRPPACRPVPLRRPARPAGDVFAGRTTVAAVRLTTARPGARALGLPDGDDDLVVCLAVPRSALTDICRWLVPVLPPAPLLVHPRRPACGRCSTTTAPWRRATPSSASPLADTSARFLDGQTILVVPDEAASVTTGARLAAR